MYITTIEHGGRCEKEQPKVGPKGEGAGASKAKAELPKISAIRETAEAHRLFLAGFFATVRFSVLLQKKSIQLPCYLL